MTAADIEFLERVIIAPASPHLKVQHREIIFTFQTIAEYKDYVDSHENYDTQARKEADELLNNAEERLHCSIEEAAFPFLGLLRNGDVSFFPNDKNIDDFLHFLCVQHFRTKGLMDKLIASQEKQGLHSFERIKNVARHIFALNVCDSIFHERNLHRLVLLENNTSIPLITSDQPTLNIHSAHDNTAPERLAFYYLVSPSRAMLLMDEPQGSHSTHEWLDADEVEHFNSHMIRAAHKMLFSSDKAQLERIALAR